MPYLDGFKWDIFLSYAHRDNPQIGRNRHWFDNFYKLLRQRFFDKTSDELSVYFDSRKQLYNADIDEIPYDVRNAGIFLAFGSTSYLSSEWCRKELSAFQEQRDFKSRTFIIELNPLVEDSIWPELPNNKRPKFYYQPQRSETHLRYKHSHQPYQVLMGELVDQIWDQISMMKGVRESSTDSRGSNGSLGSGKSQDTEPKQISVRRTGTVSSDLDEPESDDDGSNQRSEPKLPQSGNSRTVFLAYGAEDTLSERIAVREYLEQFDIRVLPESPFLPSDATKYNEAVTQGLDEADIFVQLFGSHPGLAIPNMDESFVFDQVRQANKRAASGLTILQWRNPDVVVDEISDERYRDVIDTQHVRVSSSTEFKRLVLHKCTELPKPDKAVAEEEGLQVFIHANESDEHFARELIDLCNDCNIDAMRSTRDEGANYGENLRERYAGASVITLLYGKSGEEWLGKQYLFFQKAKATRKQKIGKPLIIGLGPPSKDDDLPMSKKYIHKVVDTRDEWAVGPYAAALDEALKQ